MGNFDLKKYLVEGKLLKEIESSNEIKVKKPFANMILSPYQIRRFAKMKTVGNVKDPELLKKIVNIISNFLPHNPNISKEEMKLKFGEEITEIIARIVLSSYIDGYSEEANKLKIFKDHTNIY